MDDEKLWMSMQQSSLLSLKKCPQVSPRVKEEDESLDLV